MLWWQSCRDVTMKACAQAAPLARGCKAWLRWDWVTVAVFYGVGATREMWAELRARRPIRGVRLNQRHAASVTGSAGRTLDTWCQPEARHLLYPSVRHVWCHVCWLVHHVVFRL
jgi:hypothetical protein